MPDSNKKAEIVIDFDEAMKYPPIVVPADKKSRRKKKESKMSENLKKMKAVLRTQHYGPGPHKDGSSQDVHGKKSSGGGSRRRGKDTKAGGKPDWVESKFGNRIVGSGNPMVNKIKAHDYGEKLAFGFKFGDDVSARLDDNSIEGGMLVHYEDDHFYVDIDGAGWTEVYKTKIKKNQQDLKKMKAVLRTQHYGPGPHKDGSSQDVHGKKGGGSSQPAASGTSKRYGQMDQKTLKAKIKHRMGRLKDIETAGKRHSDPNYKKWQKLLEKDVEEYVNRFDDLPDWFPQ